MMPAVDPEARRPAWTIVFPSLEVTVILGRFSVRSLWFPVLAVALVATFLAGPAAADEQRVSRLGLAISAMVTSLSPDLLNDGINQVNDWANSTDRASISEIKAAPFFQAEARFFVSDKIVAVAGVGKITKTSELELLPNPRTRILQIGEIEGIPRHIGLDYYFTPYTRGDFTLRPFAGGGFMDVVEAKAKVGYQIADRDSGVIDGFYGEDGFARGVGAGPGYYVEAGLHMMLPSRYSFLVNLHYRNVKAKPIRAEDQNGAVDGLIVDDGGDLENLDFSGFGLRFAININLWNKF
jgi:hypothetical protein